LFSKRFQISESLAEECEAVDEVVSNKRFQISHAEWLGISEFQWCCEGMSSLSLRWSREIDDRGCAV
jgi:hypothetical protein